MIYHFEIRRIKARGKHRTLGKIGQFVCKPQISVYLGSHPFFDLPTEKKDSYKLQRIWLVLGGNESAGRPPYFSHIYQR